MCKRNTSATVAQKLHARFGLEMERFVCFERNSRRRAGERRLMKPFSKLSPQNVAALNPRSRAATKRVMTRTVTTSRCAALLVLVVGVAAAGCSSSTASNGTTGAATSAAACKAGTEAPYASPAGAAFILPAGVTLEGDIGGDLSGDTKEHCKNAEDVEYASDVVLACVGLRNAGSADVVVTFPAGLAFVAKTAETTNGILVHQHDVTVPAGLTYFAFRPASLNQACQPGAATDHYTFGNVTNDSKLVEVLTLAKTKKVNGDVGAQAVQKMIWDVTDGSGVTDEHRTQLAAAANL
jgi:hypothetical protein